MTTKFIGIKDFRRNLSSYAKTAKIKNIRIIILKKNIPILEIKAIDEKDFVLEKLTKEIKEARKQVKKGLTHTQEELMKEFGYFSK